MPPTPGKCLRCGAVSIPNALDLGDGLAQLEGVVVGGACPRCRGDVLLVEGTILVRDGLFEPVSTAAWTRDALAATRHVFEEAQRLAQQNADEALAFIEQNAPEFAPTLKRWRRVFLADGGQPLATWISVLLGIIAIVLALVPDNDQAQQQLINELLHEQLQRSEEIEELKADFQTLEAKIEGQDAAADPRAHTGASFFRPGAGPVP